MGHPSPAAVSIYDLGDVVRLTGTAIGTAGLPAVAALGIFLVKTPDGSVATFSSAVGAASVYSTGSGGFEKLVTASQVGSWFYRFESTGGAQAADEWSFMVSPSFIY